MAVDASSSIFDSFWVQHSIPCLNDEEHCILNVGGVDLGLHCSDHHKNPAKFDTNKMAQIIADHIILGKFDVFCVQRISTAVLNTVLGIVKEADKAWESTNCANPYHDAPSMSHVIFYKTTVMVFVTKTISVLKGDKFYERIVKEFHKFFGEGLVDELPVDSSGFVGIYKLVAIDSKIMVVTIAESNFVWISRTPSGEVSSRPFLEECNPQSDPSCLTIGELNFTQLTAEVSENPDDFDLNEIAQIVLNHINFGSYEVFYVHWIPKDVLDIIIKDLPQDEWLVATSLNTIEPVSIHLVSFHKPSVLEFVDRTPTTPVWNTFYESVVKEYETLVKKGLVDRKPTIHIGFVETFKLRSRERYVKILPFSLPYIDYEEPGKQELRHLYRNISLKNSLYTLFRDSDWMAPADITRKCCYFVVGSAMVLEGFELRNSVVDEILTSGRLTVVSPHNGNFGTLENPYSTTVEVEKLEFYDPEQMVPLRSDGMTLFIYHSKNAVTQWKYMCEDRDTMSPVKKRHDFPCGGRFLLLYDPEDLDDQ